MKTYEPNQLTYEVESAKGGVLVFSDNYYPEWTATVDGKEVPVGRVNYIPVSYTHLDVYKRQLSQREK